MNLAFRGLGLLTLAVCLVASNGCNSTTSQPEAPFLPPEDIHDHAHDHHHPETFGEAMEQLTAFKTQIETAFEAGTPDTAHDALHEVGHVIELLTELANKATEDAEKRQAVTEAQNSLFDAYGKLDESMHGGPAVKYSDIKSDINTAMEKLQGITL